MHSSQQRPNTRPLPSLCQILGRYSHAVWITVVLPFLQSAHDLIPSVHGGIQTCCVNSIVWQRRNKESDHMARVGSHLGHVFVSVDWPVVVVIMSEVSKLTVRALIIPLPNEKQRYALVVYRNSKYVYPDEIHVTSWCWNMKKLQTVTCCKDTEHIDTAINNALNSWLFVRSHIWPRARKWGRGVGFVMWVPNLTCNFR